MSNSNSIINISTKNISGKCDLKCSYSFNYPSTNLIIKNNEYMITLTPENQMPGVVFNESQYTVSAINIYSPSLHKFNDSKASAEIQIEHIPVNGGNNLYVCIPIIKSSDTTNASNIVGSIITQTAKKAPGKNESLRLNLDDFTLQNVIPKAGFYNYTGTGDNKGEYIVYGMNNAIPVNERILTVLSKIIKPYNINIYGDSLFYNASGPNSTLKQQGIYISCQPTGSSKESTNILNEKKMSTSLDIHSLFKQMYSSAISQIIIILLIIMFVLFIFAKLFNYFTTNKNTNVLSSLKIPKI
jgi:carbonic anhydrase